MTLMGIKCAVYTKFYTLLTVVCCLLVSLKLDAQIINTVAGGGSITPDVYLNGPQGVAADRDGNIYIASGSSFQIRKISKSDTLSTIAGTGNAGFSGDGGLAINANITIPVGLAIDTTNNHNYLYFSDFYNRRIRRIDLNTGIITTICGNGNTGSTGQIGDGGLAIDANLNAVTGIAIDKSGNIFIADSAFHIVREINYATNKITTVAGNGLLGTSVVSSGQATAVALVSPIGLAFNKSGNLFIADAGLNVIWKMDLNNNIIPYVGGKPPLPPIGDGGPISFASLFFPTGLCFDSKGNLYISDTYNQRIRIVGTNDSINTIVGDGFLDANRNGRYKGDGGSALQASLNYSLGIVTDANDNLIIADNGNNVVRKVNKIDSIINTVSYKKINYLYDANSINLNNPTGVCRDKSGNLFFVDKGKHFVYKVDKTTGGLSILAGNGVAGYSGNGNSATLASLKNPTGICIDKNGNIFIADTYNNCIRKVNTVGVITTIAGNGNQGFGGDNGNARNALLNRPFGVQVDNDGNLYIADTYNNRIRKVDISGTITTIAGDGSSQSLNLPYAITLDNNGTIYIADTYNYLIKKTGIFGGTLTTIAGNGLPGNYGNNISDTLGHDPNKASFTPTGIAIDHYGSIYISDINNSTILKYENKSTNKINIVAGDGYRNFLGNGRFNGDGKLATTASLNNPFGIFIDTTENPNNLLIADASNRRIREVYYQTCLPLPQFVSLDASYTPNIVNLNWQTLSDASINNYIIERSVDNKKFSPIDSVKTKYGNGGGNFYYADTLNIPNLNLYYRIKYVNTSCTKSNNVNVSQTMYRMQVAKVLHSEINKDSLYVYNGNLYNQCGEQVVLRGVNYSISDDWNFPANLKNGTEKLSEIVKTGANAVRIQWYNDYYKHHGVDAQNRPKCSIADLDALLTRCEQLKIIPILCLFDMNDEDRNSPNYWSDFQTEIVSWWLRDDVVALTKKHKNYLIANLGNEIGYTTSSSAFPNGADAYKQNYINAIQQIRNKGINILLMIDAPDGGQNGDVLVSNNPFDNTIGETILKSDVLKNILFSVHSYWHMIPNNFDYNSYIKKICSPVSPSPRLPIIFGEVANWQTEGNTNCTYELNYKDFIKAFTEKNMGWLAWTWYYDNCLDRTLADYNQGSIDSLTDYGKTIVYDSTIGLLHNANRFNCTFTAPPIPVCDTPTIQTVTADYLFNNQIQIKWTSSSNKEIPFYSVLKSTNGTDFYTLRNIPVAQTDTTSFSFIDHINNNSGTLYYRIAVTDADSMCSIASYSKIKQVSILPCNSFPLQDFTVIRSDTNSVQISFNTVSNANIDSFYLQRSINDSTFVTIKTISSTNSAQSNSYSFIDKINSNQGVLQYRVLYSDTSSKCLVTNYTRNVVVYPVPCSILLPTNFRVKYNGSYSSTINFTTISDGNIGYYILKRKGDYDTGFTTIDTVYSQYGFDGGDYSVADTFNNIKTGNIYYKLIFRDTVCGTIRDTSIAIALPCTFVPLDSFNVVCNNFYVNLSWQTNPNKDISEYNIQRSIDGYTYSSIATIKNHYLDSLSYSFTDKTLDTTSEIGIGGFFYRIYYKDSKCKIEGYSDTVFLDPTTCSMPRLLLFPNPTHNYITLSQLPCNTMVGIFSTNGKMVLQKQCTNRGDFQIDVSSLNSGVYCVRCASIWSPTVSGLFIKL